MSNAESGRGGNHDGLLIYHLYADEGVESDYLSRFGRVVRVGLDPTDRNDSEPVAGDVERLVMNFDPAQESSFVDRSTEQRKLQEVGHVAE
jgi:hypothetical protein